MELIKLRVRERGRYFGRGTPWYLNGFGAQFEAMIVPKIDEKSFGGIKFAVRRNSYYSLVSPAKVPTDVSHSDLDIFPAFVLGWRFELIFFKC